MSDQADVTERLYRWDTHNTGRAAYLDAVIDAVTRSMALGERDTARAALEMFAAEEVDEACNS